MFPEENVIAVESPDECVYCYEKWRAQECNAKRVAITGSIGKTTTTGLINTVLSKSFNVLTHNPMSNSHGAVLRNVQKLEPSHDFWVQEVGGYLPEYVESTARFLSPDFVIITNIGESHLDYYKTKERIFWDKASLERYANPDAIIIVNYDDEILRNAQYSHDVISYSLNNSAADYYAKDISIEADGTYFTVMCDEGEYRMHLRMYGDFNVYNALCAVIVGRLAEIPMDVIAERLYEYHTSGMRQNMINVGGYNLFVDTFNAVPQSVLGAAKTLEQFNTHDNGKKIFVTSHLYKLGDQSIEFHEQLGHDLAKLSIDKVALFAGNSKVTYDTMIKDGFTNVYHTDSRDEFEEWLKKNITRQDIVFFKGGQVYNSLATSIDHVFGTTFQNMTEYNEGNVIEDDGYLIRLRKDNVAEICGYKGSEKDLVIPSVYEDYTIERIAPDAFKYNTQIETVQISSGIYNIGERAFYYCRNLKNVQFPSTLKIIEKNAFNNCRKLTCLHIPDGALHISRHAFYDCVALEEIMIPSSVGYLGTDVFGMSNLSYELNMSIRINDEGLMMKRIK